MIVVVVFTEFQIIPTTEVKMNYLSIETVFLQNVP